MSRARGPLAGQTALVTGGARRIGAAIVHAIAAAGGDVVIHYASSRREADALRQAVSKAGRKAWTVKADLSRPGKAGDLVRQAATEAGTPVTLLVNNASVFPRGKLRDMRWDDLASNLLVNAWAPYELTRGLASQLPADRKGSVVNLLDARIADYDWDHVAYWLSKRTLADLTRLCAVDLAPRLRVNGVAPGPVLGPEGDKSFPERLAKHLPLRETPTPEDVAAAVVQLLASGSVTGEVVHVDGGRHLGRAVYG